nr:hypothetical protein [Pseudomonas chlororaphis]
MKWLVISVITLLIVFIVAAYTLLERVDEKVPTLKDHPNAHWSGAQDGGVFFEITKADPPAYYIEIRYESGNIWSEGWVKHVVKAGEKFTNKDLLGYDGGDVVYLQDGTVLTLNPKIVK